VEEHGRGLPVKELINKRRRKEYSIRVGNYCW
jgi:hypothetical protein